MDTETAYYNSPLGVLEIKTTDEFVNSVLYINTWKGPTIAEGDVHITANPSATTQQCINQLQEYFDGTRKEFSLKIQQSGTDFQLKVWDELFNINYGKTISYLELSKRIGNVKAIRAVGTTNGNNNINIIVPCHRVIGSNGSLIGYGGELWRKQWLLEHEGKFANGVQTLF